MDDKNIMATILGNLKGGCDLMMHGSIESNTANVRSAFNCALNDFLKMPVKRHKPRSTKDNVEVKMLKIILAEIKLCAEL